MRVVAGSLRSRRLHAPPGNKTRPTSDRVRESLFAVLGDLTDACVLDLYAGSGALSIEAVSRGASRAVCVEAARAAAEVIRRNVSELGLQGRVTVVQRRVRECGAAVSEHAPFDLVFADPPWAEVPAGSLGEDLGALLSDATLLSPSALLALEHAQKDAPPGLAGLDLVETRRWGDTAVSFFRVRTPESR